MGSAVDLQCVHRFVGCRSARINELWSPPPSAAAQRGYKHWLVIGIGGAVLILIFLANR